MAPITPFLVLFSDNSVLRFCSGWASEVETKAVMMLDDTKKTETRGLTRVAIVHFLSHLSCPPVWNVEAMAGIEMPSCDVKEALRIKARG